MLRFLSRLDKAYWFLAPTVLCATWPWFSYRFRAFVPFAFVCIWVALMDKHLVRIAAPRRLSWSFWMVVLGWFLLTFLDSFYAVLGHGSFTPYFMLSTSLVSFSHFIIIYLSLRCGKFNELKFLFIIACIGTILAGIGAFRGGMIEGFEGGRALTTSLEAFGTDEAFYNVSLAYQIGSANYGTTYMFAIILLSFVWMAKRVKSLKYRFVLLFAVLAVLTVVRNSGLGTPVVVVVYGLFLYGLSRTRLPASVLVVIGLLGPVFLIVFSYKPTTFSFVSPLIEAVGFCFPEGSSIANRMQSICKALSGDTDTYAFARYQLQKQSFEVFLDHPFFGVGMYNTEHATHYLLGGHSGFLDLLGKAGLPGFFAFAFNVGTLMYFYKRLTISFGWGRDWIRVISITVACYVFAAVANPLVVFPTFCYYVPVMAMIVCEHQRRTSLKQWSYEYYVE